MVPIIKAEWVVASACLKQCAWERLLNFTILKRTCGCEGLIFVMKQTLVKHVSKKAAIIAFEIFYLGRSRDKTVPCFYEE